MLSLQAAPARHLRVNNTPGVACVPGGDPALGHQLPLLLITHP